MSDDMKGRPQSGAPRCEAEKDDRRCVRVLDHSGPHRWAAWHKQALAEDVGAYGHEMVVPHD